MRKSFYTWVIIFFCVLFSLNFILSEDFGYNLLESGEGLSPSTNFSLVNVNDSNFLQGFVPADFWQSFNDQAGLTGDKSGSFNLTTSGFINPFFSIGSVVFINASGLAQDNANLFWDDGNDFLRIKELIINQSDSSTATTSLTFQGNDKVGDDNDQSKIIFQLDDSSSMPFTIGELEFINTDVGDKSGRFNFRASRGTLQDIMSFGYDNSGSGSFIWNAAQSDLDFIIFDFYCFCFSNYVGY